MGFWLPVNDLICKTSLLIMNYLNQTLLTILLAATMALSYSCQQAEVDFLGVKPISQNAELKQIPLEEALKTLDDFLSENESDMLATRSGSAREIASIFTYYKSGRFDATSTRSSQTSAIPDAYLINFADGEGFAVLGANNAVVDIIAITEKGQIQEDLQVVLSEHYAQVGDATETGDDDLYEISEDSIGWYCDEDDDFYTGAIGTGDFVTECIKVAIHQPFTTEIIKNENTDTGSSRYVTRTPMLQTNWAQDSPYNRYCKRQNLILQWKSALTGCSTTAMAMIVAQNEYPQTLIINGNTMDWDQMKTTLETENLSEEGLEDMAMLMATIFANVKKLTTRESTLITARQIEKRMKEFKYTNVVRYCSTDFTESFVAATSDMLAQNKPVFISAIPKQFAKGHSWVIDGAKYSSEDESRYLLHFNFGWEGHSNGYFSTTCLNPAKADEYDDDSKNNTSRDRPYSWHFRLITYDIPAETTELNADYSY